MGVEGRRGRAPLVSFVIPVHGVEPYLRPCLDSVLAGADDRVEVVAVNDASPDRCGEVLDDYQHADPRVHAIHLRRNVGPGQARNAGLEQATGAYLWFVDGDDLLPAGALPVVLAHLERHRPDVLVVDHAEFVDHGPAGHRPQPGFQPTTVPVRLRQRPQLLRLAPSACTKIIRRGVLDEIKLRFSPGLYEDGLFSRTMLMAAERIEVLDQVCYHYRQRRRHSRTRTVSRRHFDVFDQYDELFARAATAGPDSEVLVPELFRAMIDHYLVIVGSEHRVPPRLRRRFFHRMAADFRARLPAGGYEHPRGVAGLKHRLVRHDAYRTYAILRLSYRMPHRCCRALQSAYQRLRSARRWPRPTAALRGEET